MIICHPCVSRTQEEKRVAGNSPMVSLRIPEDHLMELDRLVGFDGMRNRSDVIREAVRRLLSSALPGKGDRVEVDLGPELTIRLRDYCKIVGESADVVLRQAARETIRKEMVEGDTVGRLLKRRMEELRSRFDEDSNA
jgi:Arc/MetJ-type ribon-helix-helix transcriptional regulator|tara:strand:- start:4208 stop:4621 length:414 start_codon:yes stop_codon:yes gene_type:complete